MPRKRRLGIFVVGGLFVAACVPIGSALKDYGFFHSLGIVAAIGLVLYARHQRLI
ncbi:MAG: hypothetical protein M5R36_13630 [Deltaproteobacteria bacterium]|nr:hypothetical protein [Deltaproteobacteria bacterium]